MKLFVLTLLVAGLITTLNGDSSVSGRDPKHMNKRSADGATCVGENCNKIFVGETFAGDCSSRSSGCRDLFCYNGEVIDRSTCTPEGRLEDCKCISTTTIAPSTTVPPSKGPLAGCEACLNNKLSVSDRWAGLCFPNRSNGKCSCLCADVFCNNDQVIDRATCVSGGSLSGCKCIDVPVAVTTSSPTPVN